MPDQVHEHYVEALKRVRPRRRPPKLSPKDRKAIQAHLRSGLTLDDLRRAVDGLLRSPHHLGQNDRSTEYLELEYALRKPTQMASLVDDAPASTPLESTGPPPEFVDPAAVQALFANLGKTA